jgi:hypothetical protein
MNASIRHPARQAEIPARLPQVNNPSPRGRINAREAGWQWLAQALAVVLGCLEGGHFLILSTRDDEPYYVQFACGGREGMRVEAVSNRFLGGWRRLDRTAEGRLRRLGWRPPTDIGEGAVNWWRVFPEGGDLTEAADLVVATMRKAYDTARPAELVYRAFSRSGEEILLPTLGLDRQADRTPLDERVGRALSELLETEELQRDDDGDWPIRSGDAMVYVRVMAEPAYVAVFSPAVLDVTPSPELVDAVNQFNSNIRVARAFLTGRTVTVAAETDDQAEVGETVVNAFKAVSSLTQCCADELQARFGGRRYFGEPVHDPLPDQGYGF